MYCSGLSLLPSTALSRYVNFSFFMNYFQSKLSNIFRSSVIYISGMSSPILPAASVVGKQVAILIIQSFLVTN
jgi:hypothetical protein